MTSASVVRAVARYEFRMQLRKRSLWIVMGALAVLVWLAARHDLGCYANRCAPRRTAGEWMFVVNAVLPIGFGTLLADRLVRDERLRVTDLLDGLPPGLGSRLLGKYLGAVGASVIPVLGATLVGAVLFAVRYGRPTLLAWALLAFVLAALPGLLFVAAFALVCPLFMPTPLFRVLFVGYWFWGNMIGPPAVPSISDTLLTPVGGYPLAAFFGLTNMLAGDGDGPLPVLAPAVSPASAVLSAALLIAVGLLALYAGRALLLRRAAAR